MGTAAVGTTDLKAGASPPARMAGLFYLLVSLFIGGALFVVGGLLISGDAAATASNILAHATRRSRNVPRHTKVVPARNAITIAKNRKIPIAVMPSGAPFSEEPVAGFMRGL